MRTPKVLDLFSCAGGAAKGYQAAGFEVFGVDIDPQPDYCGNDFQQDDAIAFVHDNLGWIMTEFVMIHASPPCQGEGAPAKGTNAARIADGTLQHSRLIGPTRRALELTGLPYVIENVNGSEVRKDMTLCGEMFGLGVIMHRHFELGRWAAKAPEHKTHRGRVRGWRHGQYYDGPYIAAYGKGGGKGTVAEMQQAKGIDWTGDHLALREALPPAYTQYIGQQFLAQQGEQAA
jgi:hypothetical protein